MGSCAVEGCNGKLHGLTYCDRHYRQLLRYGKLFERTKNDRNTIQKKDDYYIMELYNKKHEVVALAYFDLEDYDKVAPYKWSFSTGKYARNQIKGYLHDYLLEFKFDNHKKQIDHINRNKLDCRKSNLRFVDHSENNINRDLQKNNVSGCKGVTWNPCNKKWLARITRNHKEYFLGNYRCLDHAIAARKKAEKELHVIKKYSTINPSFSQEILNTIIMENERCLI